MSDIAMNPVPAREQYWREIDVNEKIERMRRIIKSHEERLSYTQELVWKLQREIEYHVHQDKKVFVPIEQSRSGTPLTESPFADVDKKTDEVYF